MKTIGMIGGISWESTAKYYSLLNEMVRDRVGGLHSAELLMWSFDFADIEALQTAGDWDEATREMIAVAQKLEQGGAQCLMICANTMHKMADEVQDAIDIPLIHIADVTAAAIREKHVERPLLLATSYTMEQDFYTGRLERNGVTALIPDQKDRDELHRIIFEELCQGIITPASKQAYLDIIARTPEADGVIFGCTEIGLLLKPEDVERPCFDTTELHATAVLDFSLPA